MSIPYHTHSPAMSSTVSIDGNGSVSDSSESDRDSSKVKKLKIIHTQYTTHALKNGQKLIGELHDRKNLMYLDAILREVSREGFQTTLAFPHRSKWLARKIPVWFSPDGILGRYFFPYTLFPLSF